MILSEFYLILVNRLKDKVPAIKHIDWWNDQFDNEEKENPFNRPAVFIEFLAADVTTLGNRKQSWNQPFSLYIANDMLLETSSVETAALREKAVTAHLDILDSIHYYLQNYNGKDQGVQFGSIQQQGSPVSHNYDDLIVHQMNFTVRLENKAAVHKTQKVIPPLPKSDITVKITEL